MSLEYEIVKKMFECVGVGVDHKNNQLIGTGLSSQELLSEPMTLVDQETGQSKSCRVWSGEIKISETEKLTGLLIDLCFFEDENSILEYIVCFQIKGLEPKPIHGIRLTLGESDYQFKLIDPKSFEFKIPHVLVMLAALQGLLIISEMGVEWEKCKDNSVLYRAAEKMIN